MKAQDFTNFAEVIVVSNRNNKFEELVKFLLAARKVIREALIESELIFSYAKTGRLADLEDFISSPNLANVSEIGDRCFEGQMFEAARILFSSVSNWARLATTLVRLQEYQAAVDCARKANATKYHCLTIGSGKMSIRHVWTTKSSDWPKYVVFI